MTISIDKYPILYRESELKFDNFGLAICRNAYDLTINEVINGEYNISFEIPVDNQMIKSALKDAFWIKCDNTVFYITKLVIEKDQKGGLCAKIEAEHAKFFIRNSYVPFVKYAAKTAFYIINDLLTNYVEGPFRFQAATWMNYPDIFTVEFQDKNVLEIITELAEKFGGELDCANMPNAINQFDIGIRKPTYDNQYEYTGGGKGDFKLNIQIRENKNVIKIKKEIDKSEQITKLFVFGKNGGSINNHTVAVQKDGVTPQIPPITIGNVNYLSISPTFHHKVAYVTFNDISNKTELYWAGKSKFDELTKPKVSYEIEIVDLRFLEQFKGFDNFQVGDVVTFIDEDLIIDETQDFAENRVRVIEYERYPLEPEKNSVVLSTTKNNMFYTFNDFYKSMNAVSSITDKQGKNVVATKVNDSTISKKEVISDGVNPDYAGWQVAGTQQSGLKVAKSDADNSQLFLEKSGKVYLLNEQGVGFYINQTLAENPQIRSHNGTNYVFHDILTTKMLPVTITNPQNGQVLKYDATSQTWKNSF